MPHISNDSFLGELAKMSKRTFSTGSVSVTFKRYNEGVNCFPSKMEKPADCKKNMCLVRAMCQKVKISTMVSMSEVAKFNSSISTVLRGSIVNLERKQKKTKKASD